MRSITLALVAGMATVGVGCRPKPGSSSQVPPPDAVSSPLESEEVNRAQGTWAIVKAEMPPRTQQPSPEDLKQIEGTVNGKLLTIWMKDEQSRSYFVFSVDPTKNPKEIDLIESSSAGSTEPVQLKSTGRSQAVLRTIPRDRYEGIYMVDGDTLVVASASVPGGPRPTEFKAKNAAKFAGDRNATTAERSGVFVVYLKRK